MRHSLLRLSALVLSLGYLFLHALPSLLTPEPYPAAVVCWRGAPTLVLIHDISNSVIYLGYLLLPAFALKLFLDVKGWRIARAFPLLATSFGAFVLTCGLTHLMGRTELYIAVPTLSAWALVVCALATVSSILVFVRDYPALRDWLASVRAGEEFARDQQHRGHPRDNT